MWVHCKYIAPIGIEVISVGVQNVHADTLQLTLIVQLIFLFKNVSFLVAIYFRPSEWLYNVYGNICLHILHFIAKVSLYFLFFFILEEPLWSIEVNKVLIWDMVKITDDQKGIFIKENAKRSSPGTIVTILDLHIKTSKIFEKSST